MQIEPSEVYAIRYATSRERTVADNYLGGGDVHDGNSDLDYYIWVLRRREQVIVVDTGFGSQAAAERGKELLIDPVEALDLLSIKANAVENVVLTHLHFDHAGNLAAFPKARFHVQVAEAAFATGRCMCHSLLRRPYSVDDVVQYVRTLYDGRVQFHDGVSTLANGLTLHKIGGHTAGLQVVRVWTRRGWVVLAADAVHLYGNLARETPFPTLCNVADVLEGYREIRRLADSEQHIIAGHDPLVMRQYPSPTPELQGIVAMLDVLPHPAIER